MGTTDADDAAGDGVAAVRPRVVGTSSTRIDSREKVTGRAVYGSDLDREELLHARVLRAERATHARVVDVGLSGALELDGVHAAVSREDLIGRFDDRVRHYGDVLAAVAAEDAATAERALRAIDVELEPLEAVHDAREALHEDAPRIHENNPDYKQYTRHDFDAANDAFRRNLDDYHHVAVGDVDAAFAAADHVHETEFVSPRVNHCNLDTHCTIAEWDDDGTLVLTETIGSPGRGAQEIAEFLGLPIDRVTLRSPPTASSSFGGRSLLKFSLEPVAATLARDADRPVKLWFDREEEFVATETRHRTHYTVKTGVTEGGDLTALQLDVVTDTGGYPNGVGHIVLTNSRDRPLELYDVEHYAYEGVSVYTNNVPAGEYRGIGSTQMTFALESHMDEVCRDVGLDPIAFRDRNLVEAGQERPHTGIAIESCGVRECLERGHDRFMALREGPRDDDWLYGWGFAAGTHTTASGGYEGKDESEARIELRADGSVLASTAAIEHGQGAHTVMAQIVAEEVGVPVDRVEVERFPTDDDLTDVLGSIASRTTYIIGAAVRDAAWRLHDDLAARAAERFDVDPAGVSFADGRAVADGHSIPVGDLVPPGADAISATGFAESTHIPPSYGVHFAEVRIDPATMRVEVPTYVAAQDVGFAVNPMGVEGQLEGAILHGMEFALYSTVRLDDGVPENPTLVDYPAVTPLELPGRVEVEIVESNEETGPYGAKGIGTPAMPPIAPAVLNALRDATGVRFTDPPIDPSRVFAGLEGER